MKSRGPRPHCQIKKRVPYRLKLESLEDRLAPATFVVNSTDDLGDANLGDGIASTGVSGGVTTLRAAIEEANAFAGPDIIEFDLPGVGPFTFTPATEYPTIVEGLTIDGTTEDDVILNTSGPDAAINASLQIIINGEAISGADGLTVSIQNPGEQAVIRGLVINGFQADLSNAGAGILLESDVGGHIIEGNFIGTDVTGAVAVPNRGGGIVVHSANNRIGGLLPENRNLISGNTTNGILIQTSPFLEGADNNLVQGNFIGVAASGIDVLLNTGDGVAILGASGNLIGGTDTGARNVISGNGFHGVSISVEFILLSDIETITHDADNNRVEGNFIGADITGTLARGNGASGVTIQGGQFNIIGGTGGGARNLISGNAFHGVLITESFSFLGEVAESERNLVQGNAIGTQIDGVSNLGNGGAGVRVERSSFNAIGGTSAGAGNIIAFNRSITESEGTGVEITDGSTSNPILGNSIFSNLGLGIDLFEPENFSGFTENDVDDVDSIGGNRLQNFPVLASAVTFASGTTITGSLNSTPSSTFRIEFFANLAADDDSPAGEGRTFLGFIERTTDAGGDVSFSATFTLPAGQNVITATATDITLTTIDGVLGPANDTSEFSRAITAIVAPPPPPSTVVPVQARVFHPFRLVRRNGVYLGFITLLSRANLAAPTTIVLRNLKPGVRLLNATGTTPDGSPFITVNRGLKKNVPLRIRVVYTNTMGRYDITFYNGFRVDVFSGTFV